MKKLSTIVITLFAVLSVLPVFGQSVSGNRGVEYTAEVLPRGEFMDIRITIDPSALRLKGQEMMVFTPVLVSVGDGEEVRFAPVVLSGGKRLKVLNREIKYGNMPFETTPELLRKHRNGKADAIMLSYSLSTEEWMRGADLLMLTELSGCVKCDPEREQLPLASIPIPEFRVTYIIPQAETKSVSERYTARLNYVVDKYDLLVNYKDNARILAEVDQIISRILGNPDFSVTYCRVDGYASPEGRYERNVILADNRAEAFVNYLAKNYNWDRSMVSSEGHAEDWQGLRDTVSRMTWLGDRDRVLDVIDNTPNVSQRKNKLKSLSGGNTYRNLLATVYPPLRRNEFEIRYEIRPYSVEEARELFKSQPHLLNLNELFFVAQSYPAGSEEFKEVFDTAVRMFPDSDISKINAGAMEIEQGMPSFAVGRLEGVAMPEAWNNLGVAYAISGQYSQAAEYLQRAADAGELNGQHNLKNLNLVYREEIK